jgi:RND family efflux transporter MFP subunit
MCVIFGFTGCSRSGAAGDGNGAKGEQAEKAEAGVNENKKGKTDKQADTDAVPVQVVNPLYGDISSFMLFSGNIDSEKTVDVYPMTNGIIEKIAFDEGDTVKKGAVLAVLDDREARINEKKSKIEFQKLKMEFTRQEEIFRRQLISKEAYDRLKFSLEQARLEWEQKKLFFSYTRITSPISGVVTARLIKVGNKINTAQLAFKVVQDREKIVVVNIPEQEKGQVYLKQDALVMNGDVEVKANVKRMSPAIDPESGTFKVTLEVLDTANKMVVGQFVNVKIIKKVHKNVLLLTKEALVYEGGKVFVFVLDKDDKAMKKEIRIGFDDGSRVEVMDGLQNDSDRVVTAGKSTLKNKTLVKIIEPVVS